MSNEAPDDVDAEEKRQLLLKFWFLEQQGVHVHRRYTMRDSVHEMRYEYEATKRRVMAADERRMMMGSLVGFGTLMEQVEGRARRLSSHAPDQDNDVTGS